MHFLRTLVVVACLAPAAARATVVLVNVTPEPSLPFDSVSVAVTVTDEPASPSSGTVEVHGSDGSFARCEISNGIANCPMSFDTAGMVTLTASFPGNGTNAPATGMYVHTVTTPLAVTAAGE